MKIAQRQSTAFKDIKLYLIMIKCGRKHLVISYIAQGEISLTFETRKMIELKVI